MAYVKKRPTDKARGKSGKWTCCWKGPDGKVRSCVGVSDRAASLRIAQAREAQDRLVREGLVDPGERARREASLRPPREHVEEYRLDLLARGDTAKHASWTANALLRLLDAASISDIAEIPPERPRAALARMKASGSSARTCNSYLAALKAFLAWLEHSGRIAGAPKGLMKGGGFNEKEDRRLVRRALSLAELARLLEAAERGPTIEASRGPRSEGRVEAHVRYLTGPERAALYRLAMGTGFRANEIRTLTPERFDLDGDNPTVTVLASYAKNGREAVQPITRELAAGLKPFLEGKDPGQPVLHVPMRTAEMLRADLERAGIDPADSRGRTLDFHALRGSYITHLVMSGANIKVVQSLARHSTITLTMDRYATVQDGDLRKALEGDRGGSES